LSVSLAKHLGADETVDVPSNHTGKEVVQEMKSFRTREVAVR
jgi:hypothetical protein